MTKFELSELQARAILDMRLQKLTGLERDKLRAEFDELMATIEDLEDILARIERRMEIITSELIDVRDRFGDERRSDIEFSSADVRMEDLIADEQVIVSISHAGYIKRTRLADYRSQSRGGVGSKGATTRDEDFVENIFAATNHNWLLIFTAKGRCFWIRIYELPEGSKTSKGRAIQNLIQIEPDDKILTYIPVTDLKDEEYANDNFVVLATRKGLIKKTTLAAYSRPRSNGINAITIREGDELLTARLTNGDNEIIIGKKSGKAIRFHESTARAVGRTAMGVKGVTLESPDDEVIGMVCVRGLDTEILVVSENGFGKRSAVEDYRITNRGGKGVKTLSVTEKTGNLISILNVTDEDDLMIINRSGITIRTGVEELRVMGRATQGVKLISLRGDDQIASVCRVPKGDDEEEYDVNESESGPSAAGNEPANEGDSDTSEGKDE
jgi:DNA gyrase subunit A